MTIATMTTPTIPETGRVIPVSGFGVGLAVKLTSVVGSCVGDSAGEDDGLNKDVGLGKSVAGGVVSISLANVKVTV